jgi:hypothetical protein
MILGVSHGRMAARSRRLRLERRAPTTSVAKVALLSKANPRIDHGVQDINREIDDDECDGVSQHGARDQGVVARLNRCDQK